MDFENLELTDEKLIELDKIISDPKLFIESVLKIQNKRGDLVSFKMNKPQERLYKEFMRQKKRGEPVRIIILKARQMGFSTLVSALFYHIASTTKNINSMIVAHKAEASTNIFNKQKLYFETEPSFLQPMRKASNAKEVIFENPTTNAMEKRSNPGLRSKIEIETAVSKDVGRSKTIHYMHLSELAFWPYAEETMLSCLQSVPNEKGTAVIIESTANGIGGAFYEEWQRAENGLSAFVPIFFPWYEMEEYRMPVPDDFFLTEEEEELKQQFDLDDEQIVWRRWCINANCLGDVDKFKQEYPATPHEAFLASGRPVFDNFALDLAIRDYTPPMYQGSVQFSNGQVRFRTEYKGNLRIWEPPKEGREYVIGIDVASGDAKGDYSCAAVFDCSTKREVAEWHGHTPPDTFGLEVNALGKYYNTALLVPEANNHGVSTISELRKAHYPKIYRRRPTPDNLHDQSQDRYGWWTSEQSKKLLINNFAKFVREGAERIQSKDALKECVSYVYDERGRSAAQSGCHDDRVIACALGVFGLSVAMAPDPNFNMDYRELYHVNSVTGY